jgi:hypothetical protein
MLVVTLLAALEINKGLFSNIWVNSWLQNVSVLILEIYLNHITLPIKGISLEILCHLFKF